MWLQGSSADILSWLFLVASVLASGFGKIVIPGADIGSLLGGFFPWFLLPLLVLGRVWWLCVGHWGFWIKCISRCWELTLRNGDRVGVGAEGILRKEESRMFHQDLLNLLGLGAESEESHNRSSAAELGMGLC